MEIFECPKITFDLISIHFTWIRNFNFSWQNGCRRPFWMSEIHFRSHFWPFQIDTKHYLFWNFWQNGWRRPFGCPKLTFYRISGHFRSIRNFILFGNFWQNGCRRPFWMSEIHFRSHLWPFQIDWPFGFPKFTFNRNSGYFRSIQNICFPAAILDVWKSLWIAFLAISDWSAILDVQNSLSMAFLAISDTCGTLYFFKCSTKWPPAAILDVRK